MKLSKNNYISEFLPERDDKINDFFWSIDYIVDHLEYTLKLERHRFIDILDRLNSGTIQKTVKKHSFKKLFTKEEYSEEVIKILTEEGYLISGKWFYSNYNKSIAIPFYVLRDYYGLIKDDGSPLGTKLKTWCSGLGITYDDVKNLKTNPQDGINPTRKFKMAQKEFFVLFKSHFKPIRELV